MRLPLLALVLPALVVAGCGSRSPSRDDVIADLAPLVASDDVDEAARVCVATRLVDDLGIDAAEDLPIEARKRVVDDDLRIVVIDAYRACGVVEQLLADGTD